MAVVAAEERLQVSVLRNRGAFDHGRRFRYQFGLGLVQAVPHDVVVPDIPRPTPSYVSFDHSRHPAGPPQASSRATATMHAMDQRFELRYVADPAAVFAMITDEGFLAKKLVAIGALSHEVAVI